MPGPPPRRPPSKAKATPPPRKGNAPPPRTAGTGGSTRKPPVRPPGRAVEQKIDASLDGYSSPEVDSDEEEADNEKVEQVRRRPLPPAKPAMPKNDLPPPPKEDPDSKIRNVIYNIAIGKVKGTAEMEKAWFWSEAKDGKFSYETNEWLNEKLRVAAGQGNSEAVVFLLGKPGADIDGFDIEGNTAMHFAVMGTGGLEAQKKTIKVLFEAGADIDRTNHDDRNPKQLDFAVCRAQAAYLRELDIAKKEKPPPVEDDGDDEHDEPVYRARTELTSFQRNDPGL